MKNQAAETQPKPEFEVKYFINISVDVPFPFTDLNEERFEAADSSSYTV